MTDSGRVPSVLAMPAWAKATLYTTLLVVGMCAVIWGMWRLFEWNHYSLAVLGGAFILGFIWLAVYDDVSR